MTLFNIAIPFFMVSIIIKYIKNKDLMGYTKFVTLILFIASAISYFIYPEFNLASNALCLSTSIFYVSLIIKKNVISNIFKIAAFTPILLLSYHNGLSPILIACQAMLAIISYYALNNFKSNITAFAITIVPLSITLVYLSENIALITIIIMSFLASLRYFVESKQSNISNNLVLLYLLVISLFISTTSPELTVKSIYLILAGLSFAISAYILQTVSKHKEHILTRINHTHELMLTVYAIVFVFNAFALILMALSYLGFISIWISVALIICFIIFATVRLLYLESEAKSKYYKG